MVDYYERQREIASKGGKATLKKYGKKHFVKIGKQGGRPKKSKSPGRKSK